jgi:hypothetical protein
VSGCHISTSCMPLGQHTEDMQAPSCNPLYLAAASQWCELQLAGGIAVALPSPRGVLLLLSWR